MISSGQGFLIGSIIISLTLLYVTSSNKEKWASFLKKITLASFFINIPRFLKKHKGKLVLLAVLGAAAYIGYLIIQENIKKQRRIEDQARRLERDRQIALEQKQQEIRRAKDAEIRKQDHIRAFDFQPFHSDKNFGMTKDELTFRTGKLIEKNPLNDFSVSENLTMYLADDKRTPKYVFIDNEDKYVGAYINCGEDGHWRSLLTLNFRGGILVGNVDCGSKGDKYDGSKSYSGLPTYQEYKTIYCSKNPTERIYKFNVANKEVTLYLEKDRVAQMFSMTENYSVKIPSRFSECNVK